jgi:hypothetical protein
VIFYNSSIEYGMKRIITQMLQHSVVRGRKTIPSYLENHDDNDGYIPLELKVYDCYDDFNLYGYNKYQEIKQKQK